MKARARQLERRQLRVFGRGGALEPAQRPARGARLQRVARRGEAVQRVEAPLARAVPHDAPLLKEARLDRGTAHPALVRVRVRARIRVRVRVRIS